MVRGAPPPMKTSNSKLVSLGAAGIAALGAWAFAAGGGKAAEDLTPVQWTQAAKGSPKRSAARVPARIVENRGQLDARVAAAVTGSRRQVFFTKDSVKIRLLGERKATSAGFSRLGPEAGQKHTGFNQHRRADSNRIDYWRCPATFFCRKVARRTEISM